MDKQASPGSPYERQRQAAKALDESVQAQMARANMGLSPVSMALAAADWALHLAVSPGRQMVLGQRALALAQQAWLASARPATDAEGQPLPEKDARFRDASWQQWPFNAVKESFKASDAWWREAAQVDGLTRGLLVLELFLLSLVWFGVLAWSLSTPRAQRLLGRIQRPLNLVTGLLFGAVSLSILTGMAGEAYALVPH